MNGVCIGYVCHFRHIIYLFARCVYKEYICLLSSMFMHVQGIYIYLTGHYVVVNKIFVCKL